MFPAIAKNHGTAGVAPIPRWVPAILRVGVAGCFIGHGAFGIVTKAAWLPYFAVGGIAEPQAWQLMPWVGTMDIAVGLLAFAWPCRALFLWAALWAVWTALLRPLSGESFWEFLERAGNYGVPLAILGIAGLAGPWFRRIPFNGNELPEEKSTLLARILWVTTITLLAGHGGLGLFAHKQGLALHYAALGFADATGVVAVIGALEFLLAALVLLRPSPNLLVGVCLWKLATESLFLIAGLPVWEVVERFGSYTAPLALALLVLPGGEEPRSHPSPAVIV
jgi:hypothetical protein